jgi:8-oxo-dGTP pyrophosphatase MutT (NUDIX family)
MLNKTTSNPNNLPVIQRDIVSGIIFSRDAKLLMGKKDPEGGGVYSDCWHLPGGGVDEGETRLEALRREIKEETGLDISNEEINLVDTKGEGETEKLLKNTGEKVWCKMNFYCYEIRLRSQSDLVELKTDAVLIELKWFTKSELDSVKLTPPSIGLFQRLGYI